MSPKMKRPVLALGFICAVFALVPVLAEEVGPSQHFELRSADSRLGQYVLVDTTPSRDDTGMTVGLLETEGGARVMVSQRTDLLKGLSYERFEDLSSGWWAEFVFDYGFANLRNPQDFADPMQAAYEISERARQEKAPTGYTVTLSNGVSAQWELPWGTNEADEESVRNEALAKIALALAEEPMPETSVAALEILAGLEDSPSVAPVGINLIPALWDASRAAQDDQPRPRIVQVTRGDIEERPRLLKVVERNLGGG